MGKQYSLQQTDAGTTGFPYTKELSWMPVSHDKQKLIQNGPKT